MGIGNTLSQKEKNDSRHYAIKLIDEAGNESDISQWFKVIYDRKAPTFKTELPKTQNVTRGTRIDFPAKDNFSGIDSYQVKLTPYHKEWKKIPNKKILSSSSLNLFQMESTPLLSK
ncbi:MAG: hypothetical protein IPN70_01595 [Candidatus Moraniibacteriota bacterium]|nr:MAG: hypothetical protein IPN70_01595 [Candidatus Moranbacteria bacterium]